MHIRYKFLALLWSLFLCFSSLCGQENLIFSAMAYELARTTEKLKIENYDAPYYVAYTLIETETYSVSATLGNLLTTRYIPHDRSINTQMRVGSMSFDNTNFVSYGGFGESGVTYVSDEGTKQTSFENDYEALLRDLWLASDAVYKRTLAELSKKKATLENKVRVDTTADFSKANPFTSVSPRKDEQLNHKEWEERVKRISEVFKQFPDIQSSEVTLELKNQYRYFLNSDGAKNTKQGNVIKLEITAKTQAADGMPLSNFIAFYGNSINDLPSEEEIVQQATTIASEVSVLCSAPFFDTYSGPVLFERQATAELVSQTLASNLRNFRKPLTDDRFLEQRVKTILNESPFQNKVGTRILPEFLSVTDNPTKKSHRDVTLVGSYEVDDEGVQAREVKLIDEGYLKSLLTSRMPHNRVRESNGHGRGLPPQAFFSNFFLSSKKIKSEVELKKELFNLCKKIGLKYGIIIRKIMNPYFEKNLKERETFFFDSEDPRPFVLEPILVYKVYLDGKEELVRGAEISGMAIQSLKEIVGVSNQDYIYNHIAMQRKSIISGLYEESEIQASVITPSLLFESVDLKRSSKTYQTPPIAKHPVFAK